MTTRIHKLVETLELLDGDILNGRNFRLELYEKDDSTSWGFRLFIYAKQPAATPLDPPYTWFRDRWAFDTKEAAYQWALARIAERKP